MLLVRNQIGLLIVQMSNLFPGQNAKTLSGLLLLGLICTGVLAVLLDEFSGQTTLWRMHSWIV